MHPSTVLGKIELVVCSSTGGGYLIFVVFVVSESSPACTDNLNFLILVLRVPGMR